MTKEEKFFHDMEDPEKQEQYIKFVESEEEKRARSIEEELLLSNEGGN